MLENIIVAVIGTAIISIVGTAFVMRDDRIKYRYIVEQFLHLQPHPKSNNNFLESLQIEILEPNPNEIITKAGNYRIRGIIKGIPKGIKVEDLEKYIFILHTSDGERGYFPQGKMTDISIKVNGNRATFNSTHYVADNTDLLVVLAGEKSRGAFEFYSECCKEGNTFERFNDFTPIPKKGFQTDITVLAEVKVFFQK